MMDKTLGGLVWNKDDLFYQSGTAEEEWRRRLEEPDQQETGRG